MADYRAQIPPIDQESILWTYQDVAEHLLDIFEQRRSNARAYRNVLRAIDTAYRDLSNKHNWRYFDRETVIVTEARHNTGTITYDHTGGAEERLITFSSATLPTNFRHYMVIIGDTHYRVDQRLSTSTATLHKDSNPGADVAAGTSYDSYRAAYPLPIDFMELKTLFDTSQEREVPIIQSAAQHSQSVQFYDTPSTPWTAALMSTGEFYGAMEIVFSPPPDTSAKYSIRYKAMPQPLRTEYYDDGTVTTDGTTTIEGTSTAWASRHIGAVIRVSDSDTVPTSKFGDLSGANNPFYAQRIIQSVTDADTLVVDSAVTAVTAKKHVISDPIDIEPSAMFTAFLRMAEAEYAWIANLKDATQRMAVADRAVIIAIESDRKTPRADTGLKYYDRFSRAIVSTDDA